MTKVFRLRFDIYLIDAKDNPYLAADNFKGRPFPGKWSSAKLCFAQDNRVKLDFYGFGPNAFVCSGRARLICAPLEDEGEFLSTKIESVRGAFYVYNVLNCSSYLNSKKSTWRADGPMSGDRRIVKPTFHTDRFGEDYIFKVPEDGATEMFCLERTGDLDDAEFRAAVKHHCLTGVRFVLA